MSSSLNYRPEIDGLRAIAVAAVIAFHLNPNWIIGGFLGVDVFFVISGYLITAIIQRNIDAEKFSLSNFWMRRIRRLYPAMMTVVFTVAVVGNFILISPERRALVKQSIATMFSFSNILLWKTTNGYWSPSSDNIALLHTWSLSLEEQFYIVFPILLLLLNKANRKSVIPMTIAITLASLAFSIYWTDIDRSGAFYLLPTRLWELSIGSLLALLEISYPKITQRRNIYPLLSILGLVLIFVSFYSIENDWNFPKGNPLLPCAGTALVLAYSRHSGIAKRLLTLSPLQFLGRISYSLYLWHWPVIVLAKYASTNHNPLILLVIMVGLSIVSYKLIENPFRTGFKGSFPAIACMPAAVAISLCFIFFQPVSPGVPEGLEDFENPRSTSRAWNFEATQNLVQGKGGVIFGDAHEEPSIALIGSSHARVLGPTLAAYAANHSETISVLATSGIDITSNKSNEYRKNIENVNKARLDYIRSIRPRCAIIAGMWLSECHRDDFESSLERFLNSVSQTAEQVIVLSQVPMHKLPASYSGSFRKYVVAKSRSGADLKLLPAPEVVSANRIVASTIERLAIPNVIFINVYDDFIRDDGSVIYMLDGKLLYSDYHHVNDRGAQYLFDKRLKGILANSADLRTTDAVANTN